jgi:MbtH protein
MTDADAEDAPPFVVVANHEDQYSIWPDGKPLPAGWRLAGRAGTRAECLEWIEATWTDMTPASLRRLPER